MKRFLAFSDDELDALRDGLLAEVEIARTRTHLFPAREYAAQALIDELDRDRHDP